MSPIASTLVLIINIAVWMIILHVVMSWLIRFQVLNIYQPIVRQAWDGLSSILEPIYNRIRRFLPPTAGLDFAPIILFIGLYFLRQVVATYL